MKSFIMSLAACAAMTFPATLTAQTPTETWRDLGTGLYRDNIVETFYFINGYPEMEVKIQESEQTPGRYRVVNPYEKFNYIGAGTTIEGGRNELIIDASDPDHVHVAESYTGLIVGDNQELMIWSIANDYYENLYGNWILADKEGVCGKLRNGAITFPKGAVLAGINELSSEPVAERLWKTSNTEGKFRLKLPGAPDLDVTLGFDNFDRDASKLIYAIEIQNDVEKTLVALVNGEPDADTEAAIKAGEIASQEVKSSGTVEFDYKADGVVSVVAIPFYKGEALEATVLTHEINFDESEWRKCGMATFTEGLMSSNEMRSWGFILDREVYQVEVQESVSRPGLIRVVDMYGLNYAYSTVSSFDTTRKYYTIIDATDPDAVSLELLEDIGLNVGYGPMSIWSKAARALESGMSKSEVAALGYFGRHADNVITFPKESLLLKFPKVNPDGWYWANNEGQFALTFEPGQIKGGTSSISEVDTAESDTAPVYYTIGGVRLLSEPTAPGVYIRRQGSSAQKIIVK